MSHGRAGALYEDKINRILKTHKLQKQSYKHNPFDNDHADAVFIRGNKEYGIELKHVYNTSYGSYTIEHDGRKWTLASPKNGQIALYHALKSSRLEREINIFYQDKGIPFLFKEKRLTPEQKRYDIDTFSNMTKNISIPSSTASKYYNEKGVDYIQIQGLGFYHLGKNPAKIDCPEFKLSGMIAEIRLKKEIKSGNSYYRFVVQIKPSGNKPSNSKVDIDKSADFLK